MATQRRGASGRPSGTDGSDFSYRMVVDSRYQRVAEGRSRLARLILVQALHQVAGDALLLLSLSKGKEVNKFAALSAAAGLLAIVVGELGRRRTMAVLLRLYTSLSSIAVAFSVTCIIRSELFLKFMKQNTEAITSYEMFDAVRVALGILLQMVVIATTTRLLQNMSPPRRAS
ncbi:hypothetical protein SEVIR_9G196100v4 [Setaria viridis]|uniref:Uncharacterized protein n=3 Tax=Setaria TaxID=4554 RepID=K4ANK7_SETIT|nr:uncharacterized protein LOC101781726 [Setaria italica]XP_034575379.1 uncharacterized protein LOC117839212 [Setaria viridis]RCV42196.1 hypothetical protein SETIT_9G196900v2 [Setaria italica]TKV92968.1 hypothetical protein SEVIR_9G196100v2 [Setaria viridis]